MYNEARKMAWIEDAERRNVLSDRKIILTHLNRMEDAIEGPLAADLFDLMKDGRKADVLRAGNQSLGFTTYATVRRFVAAANAYLNWCFAAFASAMPTAEQIFSATDFQLVEAFKSKTFIRTEDELNAALSQKRIEDGELLPVFASLAWIGLAPKEMLRLRQDEVDDHGPQIIIRGEKLPEGFVNSTLLYYSTTSKYIKGAYRIFSVKESGPMFLRNIVAANNSRPAADMLGKIHYAASTYVSPVSGIKIAYHQLVQAGWFQSSIRKEAAGLSVDLDYIQRTEHLTKLRAADRLREYQDFKTAIGV